jgi:hypothetical protein
MHHIVTSQNLQQGKRYYFDARQDEWGILIERAGGHLAFKPEKNLSYYANADGLVRFTDEPDTYFFLHPDQSDGRQS